MKIKMKWENNKKKTVKEMIQFITSYKFYLMKKLKFKSNNHGNI